MRQGRGGEERAGERERQDEGVGWWEWGGASCGNSNKNNNET